MLDKLNDKIPRYGERDPAQEKKKWKSNHADWQAAKTPPTAWPVPVLKWNLYGCSNLRVQNPRPFLQPGEEKNGQEIGSFEGEGFVNLARLGDFESLIGRAPKARPIQLNVSSTEGSIFDSYITTTKKFT